MVVSRLWSIYIVLFLASSLVECRSTGAPGDNNGNVCTTLTPGHGAPKQTTPSPFGITISPKTYTPGDGQITVTIESRCPGTTFKGFLLTTRYAEQSKNENARPGTFTIPAGTRVTCSDGSNAPYTNRAMTHTNKDEKTSLTFKWTPPTQPNGGHIVFRATFVQSFSTYWVDVHSELLVDSSLGQPTDTSTFVTSGVWAKGPGCMDPTSTTTSATTVTVTADATGSTIGSTASGNAGDSTPSGESSDDPNGSGHTLATGALPLCMNLLLGLHFLLSLW